MLKKIESNKLRPGMFVHELDGDWLSHPFLRNRFVVKDDAQVRKIIEAGIRGVYIDTERGVDIPDGKAAEEVAREVEKEVVAAVTGFPSKSPRVSIDEELDRAKNIKETARRVVNEVMHDVRLGRAVNVENLELLVEDINASVLRNPGALTSLLRLKNVDEYTFLHSVAVGTMMVTFARSLGLDEETVKQSGVGGMVHDLGKMKVPDSIINKPGRLTDEEFRLMQMHPEEGHQLLLQTEGFSSIARDITLHHHERMDGSGYPGKISAGGISQVARMAAIVDVYDAITSDRSYHKGMQPTEALRKMWEWSKFHFDQPLLQAFMREIGIYPVGSLVRLASGRLGVVIDQNEGSLLMPRVRVFFSTKSNAHIPQQVVDLARGLGAGGGDKIVSHENPEKWGLDPMRFLLAPE